MLHLCLLFLFSESIKLETLDFFDDRLTLHAVGENIMICGTADRRLAIITPEGKQIAVYDRKGEDPLGLGQHPRVLGVVNEKIYVNTISSV